MLAGQTLFSRLRILVRACRKSNVPFVLWEQDLYSLPIRDSLRQRVPLVGGLLGRVMTHVEARAYGERRRDRDIGGLRTPTPSVGRTRQRLHVVENWAPLEELPVLPKDNAWAREHELEDKRVFLYSGTLGIKHNHELLLELARHYRDASDVRVVVISGGGWARTFSRARRRPSHCRTWSSSASSRTRGFRRCSPQPISSSRSSSPSRRVRGSLESPDISLRRPCDPRCDASREPSSEDNRPKWEAASWLILAIQRVQGCRGQCSRGRSRTRRESTRLRRRTFEISRIADRFAEILDRCLIARIERAGSDRRGSGWLRQRCATRGCAPTSWSADC